MTLVLVKNWLSNFTSYALHVSSLSIITVQSSRDSQLNNRPSKVVQNILQWVNPGTSTLRPRSISTDDKQNPGGRSGDKASVYCVPHFGETRVPFAAISLHRANLCTRYLRKDKAPPFGDFNASTGAIVPGRNAYPRADPLRESVQSKETSQSHEESISEAPFLAKFLSLPSTEKREFSRYTISIRACQVISRRTA